MLLVSLLPLTSIQSAEPNIAPMRLIPAGKYEPLYTSPDGKKFTEVSEFWIDEKPVTNSQFLAFVQANPKWQRSRISPLFSDETYLRHWHGDLDLGPHTAILANIPVVNVSWFAARAYARWQGKRLPTLAEWELVALANERLADGRSEEGYYDRILQWYGEPTPPFSKWKPGSFKNVYGVYDMHGLVWEWVDDFNTSLTTGESRGDTGLDRKFFCGSASIGASDFKDYAAFMRYGFRSSLEAKYNVNNLGFRCAKGTVSE